MAGKAFNNSSKVALSLGSRIILDSLLSDSPSIRSLNSCKAEPSASFLHARTTVSPVFIAFLCVGINVNISIIHFL